MPLPPASTKDKSWDYNGEHLNTVEHHTGRRQPQNLEGAMQMLTLSALSYLQTFSAFHSSPHVYHIPAPQLRANNTRGKSEPPSAHFLNGQHSGFRLIQTEVDFLDFKIFLPFSLFMVNI